jgi:capsular exopolysaccharide synthesis family protein
MESVDAHEVIAVLRQRWRSVVATLLVVAAVAAGVLMLQPRVYSATALVNFLPKKAADGGTVQAALEFAQKQCTTYAQLAKTPLILDPVREQLGIKTDAVHLGQSVVSTASKDQPLITVTVRGSDAQGVANLANAVAAQIIKSIPDYSPAGTADTLDVEVSLRATPPAAPISPDLRFSLLVALGIGLAAGLGQAFARAALNTRIATPADVHRVTPLPVLGEIPLGRKTDSTLTSAVDPFSARDEAYRDLRTNLEFRALEGHGNSFLVSSALPGEGKTTTAVQLARAFAMLEQRVLLLDCDLRRPRVHEALGLDGRLGLTHALLRGVSVSELIQTVDGVDVLVAGRQPANPAELLCSTRMQQLLGAVRSAYAVVIIDAPPLLPVTDAVALTRLDVAALVVAEAGQLRRRQLHDALKKLQGVEAPVLGIVLNKVKASGSGYYGYGYGYAPRAASDESEPVQTKRVRTRRKQT